jgi:hypothetical protein
VTNGVIWGGVKVTEPNSSTSASSGLQRREQDEEVQSQGHVGDLFTVDGWDVLGYEV